MKRGLDVLGSALLLLVSAPLWGGVAFAVKATSAGPVLHRTRRIGRHNELFTMYKFRTMRMDTPQVATHLLENPDAYLTPVGRFLRRSSLDELPQLINVLRGDMSLVGPRPALFNQQDLMEMRTAKGVHRLTPGITGWAQINGRDELPISVKVDLDAEYLGRRGLLFDLKILALTAWQTLCGRGVSH